MKTISVDRTYIDYTSGNFGVRVWRDQCQAISQGSESGSWTARENVFSIPVPGRVLEFPRFGAASVRAISWSVAFYEHKEFDPELRKLLRLWITFDDAVSQD